MIQNGVRWSKMVCQSSWRHIDKKATVLVRCADWVRVRVRDHGRAAHAPSCCITHPQAPPRLSGEAAREHAPRLARGFRVPRLR